MGDGEVVVAKRSGAAGYHIAIRHGRTYTTRYMHLRSCWRNRAKAKRGDRISVTPPQAASAYEAWDKTSKPLTPTAKLPRTEGLTGSDRREYRTGERGSATPRFD